MGARAHEIDRPHGFHQLDHYRVTNWHYGCRQQCGSVQHQIISTNSLFQTHTLTGEYWAMKKTHFSKSPLALAVGGIVAGHMPLAYAQDDGASSGTLEEIIVTASRREASTQDIPYNISAVSGSDMVEQGIVDTADLMRTISGVSILDRGYRNSGMTNSLVIRGVNVDNGALGDYGLSTVGTVATYVDNTPIFANFILKDIERVEVLRGPQGTLYGSGSLGGTVRYMMKRPDTSGFDAEVGATAGQFSGSDGTNYSADVMFNIPFSDTVAFRVSGGVIDNSGVIDYVNLYQVDSTGDPLVLNSAGDCVSPTDTGLTNVELANNGSCYTSQKDADTTEITHARASLRFEPTDDFAVQLNYQMQDDTIGGRRTITVGTDFNGNPYNGTDQSGSTMLEPAARDVSLASLDIDWDLGFATLTSNTSSYDHKGNGWRDNTSLWVTDRGGFANWFDTLYTGMPRPVAHVEAGFEEEAIVQEFRLVSNTEGAIDWTVGAYYMDQDLVTTNISYLKGLDEYSQACDALGAACVADGQWWVGLSLQETDFNYERRENFTDLALYGELTWHVADNWHLTAGARWYDNELTNSSKMGFPLWTGAEDPFVDYPSQKEDGVQLKFNVAWDLNDDTMVYGTYSEGFRRGGANAVPDSGAFEELNPETVQTYKADTVRNYEIGIKGSSDRLRYTADVYYVDWSDPQLNTATVWWGFFMAQNGESAKTTGVELEAQYLLTDNLELGLGYGHVEAELSADLISPQTGGVIADNGHRLPGTAKDVFTLSLTHNHQFSGGMTLLSRLNGYYQSDSINSVTEGSLQQTFPSFSLWNASATLSTDHWDFSLYLRNMFDEKGVTGNYPSTYMSTDTGTFENYYGNNQRQYISGPRNIMAGIKYRF